MGHLAVNSDFHLQAAVVRSDHLVAKTRGNHQVGVDDFLLQQPARPHLAAKFLVVSEE